MLTLTTSLALFLSAVTFNNNTTLASTASVITPVVESQSIQLSVNPIATAVESKVSVDESIVPVEQYVKTYFVKTPILAKIAKCESQFRQFGKDGKVLRGIAVRDDIGVMQINERYHGETAKKLGFDIYSIDGNLAYAQNLYDRQGTQPWSASAPCWDR